jgi:hypothetical protein
MEELWYFYHKWILHKGKYNFWCMCRHINPYSKCYNDMRKAYKYYAKGYEPFQEKDSNKFNKYGSNMREPVKGTVAVGKLDFTTEGITDGYSYFKFSCFIYFWII